ncbi:MAG TPA: hypothetical protein EYG67_00230 [Campylobacterales bacterium]|nr:hypothetical protein [Campylobacterales bacterium]HIP41751.1 hypothetical protein [Campylobacterales bacterium]
MKKNLIIILISLLFIVSTANELNLFKKISSNDLIERIMEASEYNLSKLPIDISSGDINKGKKLFIKKLQKPCDMSGSRFAGFYSQDEWEEIVESGTLKEIVIEICPKLEDDYQEAWSPHLYQFIYEYANDSGNIPSC